MKKYDQPIRMPQNFMTMNDGAVVESLDKWL